MSPTRPCCDGFLEWIGTTRREFAAVPEKIRPAAKRSFPAPWVYLYRCLECRSMFASTLEPMPGPGALLGALGSVLA